ncbi:hypothetical protein SAMN05192534_106127 [Alteribacillus persepolensis]|uniref:Uncharacterized protein n=1 Tax=Alteribacillus persepolensis TaxID=568899 RepID=A0A1G8CYP6_9BACI|nr:hypothetical protein SAMN05192534_106127 [Alteribacillus persepolensis]
MHELRSTIKMRIVMERAKERGIPLFFCREKEASGDCGKTEYIVH